MSEIFSGVNIATARATQTQPATVLKFVDGILHQMFEVRIYENGWLIEINHEWRPVESESSTLSEKE